MKKYFKLARNLKPNDKFSLIHKERVSYIVKRIERFKIAGLTIVKVHLHGAFMPLSLTGG